MKISPRTTTFKNNITSKAKLAKGIKMLKMKLNNSRAMIMRGGVGVGGVVYKSLSLSEL